MYGMDESNSLLLLLLLLQPLLLPQPPHRTNPKPTNQAYPINLPTPSLHPANPASNLGKDRTTSSSIRRSSSYRHARRVGGGAGVGDVGICEVL